MHLLCTPNQKGIRTLIPAITMPPPEASDTASTPYHDSEETVTSSYKPENQAQQEDTLFDRVQKVDDQLQRDQNSNENDLEQGSIVDGEFVTDPPLSELPAGEVDPEKASGDIMVEWDGIDDRENAQNWPTPYRCYITFLVGILTFCSAFASSSPSLLAPRIMERYQVSEEAGKIPIFMFLVGYMSGPLFWGPLSELYGVRPMVWASGLGLAASNIACAHAPNLGGLICLRILAGMFGSCPLTIGGGIIAHLWRKQQLGVGMCVFGAMPMSGPSLGPLVGGCIDQSGVTYQWIFWAMGIFTGALTIVMGLTMKETNPGINLVKKAKRIRAQTGDNRYKAPFEVRHINLKELASQRLIIPLHMLLVRILCVHTGLTFQVEPMLLGVTVYISFVYGVLYLFFDAYPVVFRELHNMTPIQIGLTFVPLMAGCLLGTTYYVLIENKIYLKRLEKSPTNTVPPEFRLRLTMVAGPILTASLFWFAWTSFSGISVWPPIVAGGFYGLGIFFIMNSLFTYMADTYGVLTASAMAANTIVRSGFGVGFPLFATQMYHKLNPRWATTVLAFISLVLVPIPFLLHKFGPQMRAKTRYAI